MLDKFAPDGPHGAYSTHDASSCLLDDVSCELKSHPVSDALLVTATVVAGLGIARLGFGLRVLPTLAEAGTQLSHLTTPEGARAIEESGRLGGRWGLFVVDSAKVPESQLGRIAKTLVIRDLRGEVRLPAELSGHFEKPFPVGPFSLTRNLIGLRSSALGTADLQGKTFLKDQVFSDGVFRPATRTDRGKYAAHQFILDYGIDSGSFAYSAGVARLVEDRLDR